MRQGRRSRARCYREVRGTARACAGEIERRYPKVLRRVGGYNLDEFVDRDRPFNLAKLIVGSEGTLGVVVEAKIGLVPLPKFKAVLAIQFADLLDALAATPAILAARAVGRRGDGSVHPRSHEAERRRCTGCGRRSSTGEPAALLCVEFYARHAPTICRRRLDALERDLAARRFGYRYHRAIDAGGAERDLAGARSRARPVDGDERRRQVALVRRRYRRRAGAAARLHRRSFLALVQRHGTDGRRLRARVGRLPARAAGRQPEDRGGRPAVRVDRVGESPTSCSSTAARCPASTATAWCAARSWRRCSAPCSTTRSGRSSGRSIRTASSIPARSSTRRR